MIRSAALIVHERLMRELPVRTHRAADPTPRRTAARGRAQADTRHLHQRIVAMDAKGLKGYQIADQCKVSPTTVSKHLNGQIKSTKFKKRRKLSTENIRKSLAD